MAHVEPPPWPRLTPPPNPHSKSIFRAESQGDPQSGHLPGCTQSYNNPSLQDPDQEMKSHFKSPFPMAGFFCLASSPGQWGSP